ncbi:MAG: hypothetical protein ACREAX_05100 [Candidatus Nitrosotenuis sp.]
MAKRVFGALAATILVAGMLVASPLLASGQTAATDKGTLKVSVSTDPQIPKLSGQTKLKIEFVNPKTNAIQEHIDYSVSITKDSKSVFGPIPLTHTSLGTVIIPVEFKENGAHQVIVDVQGILFQPIPSEKATITVNVGQTDGKDSSAKDTKQNVKTSEKPKTDANKKSDDKKKDDKKKDKAKKKIKTVKKPTEKPKT